jgi:hypothetical protein
MTRTYCRGRAAISTFAIAMAVPLCSATQGDTHLFGRDVILPSWLARYDAELRITADSIDWHGTEFRGVDIPIRLQAGVLSIDGARTRLGGGIVSGAVSHDPGGVTTLALRGNGIELGQLPAVNEYLNGVPIDVEIDLHGAGTTPNLLSASISGIVRVRNSAGGTLKKFMRGADKNVVSDFLVMLNPFRDRAGITSVECLAAELRIVDGVVDDNRVFEMSTDVVNVKAAAKIDLARETVYAAFMPEARQGVNLSSLAAGDVVVVEGDLGAPEIQLMKGHLLEKGVSLSGAIAKFGPSKLFEMIVDAQADASLCAQGARRTTP